MTTQRRRVKKEWAARIGVRIAETVWQDSRAAFHTEFESNTDTVAATHEAWCEQALHHWLTLGVRGRGKAAQQLATGVESKGRVLRLATLTREQLHQAWAADGAPDNFGHWITRALSYSVEQTRSRYGDLATPPERLPTWRTPN